MRQELTISERRACGLVGLPRTTLRRVVIEASDTMMSRTRTIDLAHARRRFGYRRIHDLLRREGLQANHKKVYRCTGGGTERAQASSSQACNGGSPSAAGAHRSERI